MLSRKEVWFSLKPNETSGFSLHIFRTSQKSRSHCRTWFWIWSLSEDLRGSPSAYGMFESWPHHVKWYILACLVSENHPKHGQKSYKIIIEDDLGLLGGLGSRIKVALDLVWPILHLLSCQKFLAQKKVRLFATCDVLTMPLRFALFASVMCAALAVRPSLLGKWISFLVFFGDQTGIDIPRKCMLFFRVFFFQMFFSLLCPWWRQQGLKITTRMRRRRLMCMSTFIRSLTRSHAVLLGQPRPWIRLNIVGWRDHASNGVNHLQLETTARLTTRCVKAKICVPSPESLKLSKPLISCERFRLHLPVGHPRFHQELNRSCGPFNAFVVWCSKKSGAIPRERWLIPLPIDDGPIPPTACWWCITNIPFWLN